MKASCVVIDLVSAQEQQVVATDLGNGPGSGAEQDGDLYLFEPLHRAGRTTVGASDAGTQRKTARPGLEDREALSISQITHTFVDHSLVKDIGPSHGRAVALLVQDKDQGRNARQVGSRRGMVPSPPNVQAGDMNLSPDASFLGHTLRYQVETGDQSLGRSIEIEGHNRVEELLLMGSDIGLGIPVVAAGPMDTFSEETLLTNSFAIICRMTTVSFSRCDHVGNVNSSSVGTMMLVVISVMTSRRTSGASRSVLSESGVPGSVSLFIDAFAKCGAQSVSLFAQISEPENSSCNTGVICSLMS